MRSGAIVALLLAMLAPGCADPFIESTTQLSDTQDIAGPYTVRTVVVGVEPRDRVELFYNAVDDDPDNFIPQLMAEDDLDNGPYRGEVFRRGIPGQPAGTEIFYYVAVTRDDEQVDADPVGGDLRPYRFLVRNIP